MKRYPYSRGACYLWRKNVTRRLAVYHILFWAAIYGIWVMVFRNYSFTLSRTMTVQFCYLAFITADYYLVNNVLVPRLLLKRRYVWFAAAVIGTIVVSAGLRALIARTLYPGNPHVYIDSLLNIALWVLLLTGAKMLVDRIRHEQQVERLEKERAQGELAYLKAQINPHALFNSLNTVYGHIDKSNAVARETLLQFSELLRYQLYDCGADKVSLGKEIAYIRNYVDFQRLRKNERLRVDFDAAGAKGELLIAPLLLIVLVENAFKFVSNFADKENRIGIRLHTNGRFLYCNIVNTRERLQAVVPQRSGGIGIANLRRRLDLLYGRRYEFTTRADQELYEANLIIELS